MPCSRTSTTLRGSDNLRLYLSTAVLPKMIPGKHAPAMPPPGKKSHRNLLANRPAPYRMLETMCKRKYSSWISDVLNFQKCHITTKSLHVDDREPETGERLSVPAPSFDIPNDCRARPMEIAKVIEHVDEIALQTCQRALHLALPEITTGWAFIPYEDEKDVDRSLFRTCIWTPDKARLPGNGDNTKASLMVFMQPPWVLASRDLDRFVSMKSFTSSATQQSDPKSVPVSGELLWAKIWDICIRKKTRYFILTSYNDWTFASFSRDWTTATVTRPLAYDSQKPTILQALTYWVISSMHASSESNKFSWCEPPCHIRMVVSKGYKAALAISHAR